MSDNSHKDAGWLHRQTYPGCVLSGTGIAPLQVIRRQCVDGYKCHTGLVPSVEWMLNRFSSFHSCLTKHLRSNIVSPQGGFVLICDLNHYYNFVASLKQ